MTCENPFSAASPKVAKWHVEKQARDGGTYRVLSKGSGKERVSLSLGYLDDEVAARCEHGINALAQWRATVAGMFDRMIGPGVFPPPDRAVDAPMAYPNFPQGAEAGPVEVPPDISPEGLIRLYRVARSAPEKQQAREKILSFLLAMHDVWPPTRAEPPKLDLDALRVALRSSQRADPGGLSLSEYVEQVWRPVRAKRKPQLWTDEAGHWARYILPILGHMRVRDLDGPRFEAFITTVRGNEGQLLSRSTLNSVKNAYRQALDHAGGTSVRFIRSSSCRSEPRRSWRLHNRSPEPRWSVWWPPRRRPCTGRCSRSPLTRVAAPAKA